MPQAEEVRRPPGGARRVVLVGSGQGGEYLVCSTFYLVLGQGLGGGPGASGGLWGLYFRGIRDVWGGPGGWGRLARFRCFFSGVAVAPAFGWQ